jgi:hypothetical protein
MVPIDRLDERPASVSATSPATCPRCGGGFHCGVADDAPCACTQIQLSEAQQAQLRQRYSGCLCLRCLREISAAPAEGAC